MALTLRPARNLLSCPLDREVVGCRSELEWGESGQAVYQGLSYMEWHRLGS